MSNFNEQLQEIKSLLSSATKSNKPLAYSTLLHLQEQSSNDPCAIQSLADSSHTLLSSILVDISDDDEEIAAQALKCLGFMIYHPSIVADIPGDDANMIVDSLVHVVATTKIKSVCNLGVWCISIQQLNASILEEHFHYLLRAIIYAIDNPIGSLSTTFEAIQAVMKLATQLSKRMRDTSDTWAPSVYRKLVSLDKRQRDMTERCLLKIRSIILPPPLTLSKVLAIDVKRNLLPAVKEQLNCGMKIQALQAWGWFARLLGPYALKNKHLINEMLKIPEQTFSDIDPQVQIASLVAWEGLIDAFVCASIQAPETQSANENGVPEVRTSEVNYCGTEPDGISKRVKLIMTPLIGIISSKCDISVHSSCLNTWCYLLHKLGASVNNPSVMRTVFEPILETVFQGEPSSKNIILWQFCLDLLDNFALASSKGVNEDLNNRLRGQSSANIPIIGPHESGKSSFQHYHVKWLPWDFSKLDFFINIIHILLSQGSTCVATENQSLICSAALRIFRSVLKGVQNILKICSITYDEIKLCLSAILRFIKKTCDDVTSNHIGLTCRISLQLVEAVTQELEPSILGSPIYKLASELKCINNLASVDESSDGKEQGICFVGLTNMLSPIIHLITHYFCVVITSDPSDSGLESRMQEMQSYVKFLLSSFDYLEILDAFITLLYKLKELKCLKIWIAIAYCLKDYIDDSKDVLPLKMDFEMPAYLVVLRLLSYPFAVCSFPWKKLTLEKNGSSLEPSLVYSESQRKLVFMAVIEAWKSLYVSLSHVLLSGCYSSASFSESLSSMLNGWLDESISMHESGTVGEQEGNLDLLSLCGDVVICVLEQILTLKLSSKIKSNNDGHCRRSFCINNSLGLVTRFMRLSWTKAETNSAAVFSVTSRVFSTLARFVSFLHLKEDILSFMEIISTSLLQWLSNEEAKDEVTNHQFRLLWTQILNCLQMSWPPIKFDSSFLKLQAPLLQRTLDHPSPSISDPTIAFWNSTYGEQTNLEYPQTLLPVLDKLSRNGKVNLCKRCLPFNERSHFRSDAISAPQRHRVTATQTRNLKRAELPEHVVNGNGDKEKLCLSSKRKRLELTEHQKEVRRAQQGRAKDSNGHGPGIRTYTSVDFSQGNEESQESQEIRDADSILEMLKRTGKLF